MITAQIYELNLTIPAFGAIPFGNLAQFRSAIWRNFGKNIKKKIVTAVIITAVTNFLA